MYHIMIFFVKLFTRRRIRFFWEKTNRHGRWIDHLQYYTHVIGAVNSISIGRDNSRALLPQRVILPLTLSSQRSLSFVLQWYYSSRLVSCKLFLEHYSLKSVHMQQWLTISC